MTFFITSLMLGLLSGLFLSLSAISFHGDPSEPRVLSGLLFGILWFATMYACLYNAVIAASVIIVVCAMLMTILAAPAFLCIEDGKIRRL